MCFSFMNNDYNSCSLSRNFNKILSLFVSAPHLLFLMFAHLVMMKSPAIGMTILLVILNVNQMYTLMMLMSRVTTMAPRLLTTMLMQTKCTNIKYIFSFIFIF